MRLAAAISSIERVARIEGYRVVMVRLVSGGFVSCAYDVKNIPVSSRLNKTFLSILCIRETSFGCRTNEKWCRKIVSEYSCAGTRDLRGSINVKVLSLLE